MKVYIVFQNGGENPIRYVSVTHKDARRWLANYAEKRGAIHEVQVDDENQMIVTYCGNGPLRELFTMSWRIAPYEVHGSPLEFLAEQAE